jgi:hypothetical protein
MNLCGNSSYVTSSLTRRCFCLLWYAWPFVKGTFHTYSMLLKISSFYTTHKSSVSPGFAKQIMPILCILCYNGSLVTWMAVSLTTARFKPLIFSVSGFALPYTANMYILMILYDFCLSPAQFCYIILYIRKVGSRVHTANQCAPRKISSGGENIVFYAL